MHERIINRLDSVWRNMAAMADAMQMAVNNDKRIIRDGEIVDHPASVMQARVYQLREDATLVRASIAELEAAGEAELALGSPREADPAVIHHEHCRCVLCQRMTAYAARTIQ